MGRSRSRRAVAHDVSQSPRTVDVLLPETTTFSELLLNSSTLSGLHAAGFVRPSPIQRAAIPVGRCGTDLIVQAKSGTGKTLVFSVIALEMIDVTIPQPQVLILAPTREIAVQIKEVIISIGTGLPGLMVKTFIGGLALTADFIAAKSCHIAVGTPGRVRQLLDAGNLQLKAVRLFVMDEADQLLKASFKRDINFIFFRLPENKQTLVVSATFPPKLERSLCRFMVHPKRVNPSSGNALLVGLRQFAATIRAHASPLVRMRNKTTRLLHILSSFTFRQCFVFCNMQSRTENISQDLASKGWPVLHLSGSMPQEQRLAAVAALQNQRCRILLTTDLAARGVDAEQVDLVVNLDLPYDAETYLHRIGRAGRFGGAGVAVTVVEDGYELEKFQNMLFQIGGQTCNVWHLPDGEIPPSVWADETTLKSISSCEKTVKEENSISAKPAVENVESQPVDENLVKTIRAHLPKLPKNRQFFSFQELKEMFHANIDVPNRMEEGFSEESIPEEDLIKAFQSMSVSNEKSERVSNENSESVSESESSLDESFSDFSDDSEDLFTDFSDDLSSSEEEEEEEGENNYCDWSHSWQNNILMRRLALQSHFYISEMLKK